MTTTHKTPFKINGPVELFPALNIYAKIMKAKKIVFYQKYTGGSTRIEIINQSIFRYNIMEGPKHVTKGESQILTISEKEIITSSEVVPGLTMTQRIDLGELSTYEIL